MESSSITDLLPIVNEPISIKEESISNRTVTFNNSFTNPQPYFFISSFCEHKKHKTSSARSQRTLAYSNKNSPRKKLLSASSSPNLSEKTKTLTHQVSQTPKYSQTLRSKSNSSFTLKSDDENINKIDQFPSSKESINSSKENPGFQHYGSPLLQCEQVEMFDQISNEKWQLKCVCGVHSGDGYLMCCDKCGFWQHYICFNYNIHTFPDNYVCAFCNDTILRCRCGNNLDYRMSIIKCTNCGYYVHKRCEDFLFGPMPTKGVFLCHFCGRSNKLKYEDIEFPVKSFLIPFLDISYYFDPEKLEHLNSLANSPFYKLIKVKFANQEMSAKVFCESVYNKFRSFFYVCHPLYKTTTSKKKRNRFLVSFLNAFDYLCSTFYNLSHEKVVEIIDTLINEDIYVKLENLVHSEEEEPFDFSENARIELPNILTTNNNIIKFVNLPPNVSLRQTKNSGLMTMTDLAPDQFVMLVDGFIGDLEEFPYHPKVNSSYYQISGTRFVLDTTRIANSPLHQMKRSIFGNCSLRLITIEDEVKCGLFISKNYLTMNTNTSSNNMMNFNSNSGYFGSDHFTGVKSGTILTLGIDFLPAYLDEDKISQWISWHWNSETSENIYSSRAFDTSEHNEKEKETKEHRNKDGYYHYAKSTRSADGNNGQMREKRKYERRNHNVNQSTENTSIQTNSVYYNNANASNKTYNKKKRGRKMKRNNDKIPTEITLFNLFEAEEAGEILINIIENDENESESDGNESDTQNENQPQDLDDEDQSKQ